MYVLNVAKILSEGIGKSLEIFILTLVTAIPLAIVIAVLRRNKFFEGLIKLYVLIIRGTPLMLQIIIVYFAPYYLFKSTYDRELALIIALVINYVAYISEIFRSGIESIPKGQFEAAYTLGMNKFQTYILIILPQVIKRVLPAMSNEVISLLKSTSMAQIIGITEMFSLAQKQASYSFSIIPLCVVAIDYLILVLVISMIFNRLEKKLEYYA